MPYHFQHLELLSTNMKSKKMPKCVFAFKYNSHSFSCVFAIDVIPFCLYITSLGETPFCIERTVYKDFTISTFLHKEEYSKLVRYLGLHYDKNNHFMPEAFFHSLDKQMKSANIAEIRSSDLLKIARINHKIEEENKIFFCGWKHNDSHKRHVSPCNLEKTRLAFGCDISNKCRELNISSCWTDNPNDETLSQLNDLIADYSQRSNLKSKK